MPATLSKIQNADDLTMFLKAKTHMSSEALEMISEVGKQRMKECLDGGLPANMVVDMFSQGLEKALQDHSMILKGKVEEEINARNFVESVHRTGQDSFSYQKVVNVDGNEYAFDKKNFNSERQCRSWLKITKKHIQIKF